MDKKNIGNAPRGSGNNPRFGLFVFAVIIVFLILYINFDKQTRVAPTITYSEFLNAVENETVSQVHIVDRTTVQGSYKNSSGQVVAFQTQIPYADFTLLEALEKKGVVISGEMSGPTFSTYFFNFLPLICLFIFMFFLFRQNAMQSSRGMQFGKSKARYYDGANKTTFADVAGHEEVKREVGEVVDFLRNPKKFADMGAKIPTGVLLVGSPGTGKTLLARAIAGEAGVAFLHISGSDFVEMFVGVGASRVRDLFEQARRHAPCIVFIDELDAVGRARGAGFGGGHDEREQTLNQMLVEMDGFESKDGIIILAATNRPDVLDPALLRPGRFDRQVTVPLPDIKEREAILTVHAKKIPMDDGVDLARFARATPGMSGADLSSMINEAALFAARKNKKKVETDDFEEARDKLLMGIARSSLVLDEKEKRMTACHEAGHALPYFYLENATPLHKVTIIPRGRALGLTVGIPEKDTYTHTRSQLVDRLVIMFGGYAAETVMYGETTTGTQNDIQRATETAHRMVCEWGMSEDVGAMSIGREEEPIFMGKEIARHKEYSEYTAHLVDKAIKDILESAKNKAIEILTDHRDQLEKLTDALVANETMDDSEIKELLGLV